MGRGKRKKPLPVNVNNMALSRDGLGTDIQDFNVLNSMSM